MSTPPDTLPDIVGDIHKAISEEIRVYQPRSNWASSLGHPCARYGVHRRRDWEKLKPHGSVQQMIFNGGKVIEKHIAKEYIERAGYEIVEANRAIQLGDKSGMFERLQIGGYIDFIVKKDGFEFPVEVKSMSPFDWDKITTIEDLLFSKKSWHRSYPGQLTIYMLARNYEKGLFLNINKLTFEPRAIWVDLSLTYAEELLKRAEVINKHLAAGTYPDRIEYDEQVCGKCDFANICLGDIVRTEADILTDDDLISKLHERDKLKESSKRYKELDDEVKAQLKGIKRGVAGDFLVIGQERHRKGYTVEDSTMWVVNIKKLQGAGK